MHHLSVSRSLVTFNYSVSCCVNKVTLICVKRKLRNSTLSLPQFIIIAVFKKKIRKVVAPCDYRTNSQLLLLHTIPYIPVVFCPRNWILNFFPSDI